MKNKRIITLLLVVALCIPMAVSAATTDEEYAKWAEEHGYVLNPEENGYLKLEPDIVSSATLTQVGGVNYGAIEWGDELRVAALKEFLKGGFYLADPAFAQDETGYNYREMYQMATAYNNIPSNTNLELVLDTDSLSLLGVSEANTGKTIEFARNPKVSISWCKQLRIEEEELYNYYCSYGIQFNGTVKLYTVEDTTTEEGQAALLNLFDKYYPTLASSWPAYAASFAGLTDEAEIRAGKLAYITSAISRGTMVAYEIIPDRIVITAPFLMNMSPSMANGGRFTAVQEGEDKYNYTLGLNDAFLDKLVAYKAAYIASPEGEAAVREYYSTAMYAALDEYCAASGTPTSLEYALMADNAAGLKTQTTYVPSAADEYVGTGVGIGGELTVKVTVANGVMTAIEVVSNNETVGIGTVAIDKLPGRILEAQSTEGVKAISGATITSNAIFTAVEDAMAQAGLQ